MLHTDEIGNFYLRNSRFERSTVTDIVASCHSNSIRRVVSVGSASFALVRGSSASSELKIDDCRVHGWTNKGPAINFGARGPLQVIDSQFSGGPDDVIAAIHLSEENAARVVLSGSVAEGPLISAPDSTVVVTIPPSARTTGPDTAITLDTRFLKQTWPLPSRVVDAVKDHNAVGNGTADDTASLQALLDKVAGQAGVVAYIPAGRYLITKPLHVADLATGAK